MSVSDPNSPSSKPRPAWAKAFEKDAVPEESAGGLPRTRLALYAIILGLGLILWTRMGSSDPPPADSPPAKKARLASQGASPADSARIRKAAAVRRAKAARDSTRPAGPAAVPEYSDPHPAPENPADYQFVRTPWESPESPALRERAGRLDKGYDRHPMARFQGVEGRLVFLRHSHPVLYLPDRRLDRIPEKAVSEFLPEWYQRGFTLHLRGHRRPFLPRHFRLMDPPGPKVPIDSAQDPLVHYAVHAYVDAEAALLIYPDTEPREGHNGWVDAEELRLAEGVPGFGATYFAKLTGGKVEAVKTFSLPDRGYRLVEVHARRDVPGRTPEDIVRGRRGAYLFAVDPVAGKLAFLVHDFDRRFCRDDKDIRFRGVVNVAGDETAEILLGPEPHFLVHEDADGLKYHFEGGYTCERPINGREHARWTP